MLASTHTTNTLYGILSFIINRKCFTGGACTQDTAELFFDDVRLPPSALLGKLNNGFYYLMNELPKVSTLHIRLEHVCPTECRRTKF